MITNLRKSGETDDEYLDRMIALEKEEIYLDEKRIKLAKKERNEKIEELNKKIDGIGNTYTRKDRAEKRKLVNEVMTIITGCYIS